MHGKINAKESKPNSSPYSQRPPATRRGDTVEEEGEVEEQEEQGTESKSSSKTDGRRMSATMQQMAADL